MLNLRYGSGFVRLNNIDKAHVTTLQGQTVTPAADFKGTLALAAVRGVASLPLHMLVRPFDCVTLLVKAGEISRKDSVLPAVINAFTELGIVHANITVLVVRGASDLTPYLQLACGYYGAIRMMMHDPDAPDLIALGATENKIPVRVNPLLAGRNRVIVVDRVRTDPLLGFTGGAECLLAACGRETQEGCARLALQSGQTLLQSFAPGAPMTAFAKEMHAVGQMIHPLFGVYLVSDGHAAAAQIVCGKWDEAWSACCTEVFRLASRTLPHQAEIVVASAGGAPWDISFSETLRGLLSASGALKPGGELLFAAECKDFGVLEMSVTAHAQGVFQQQMLEHPTMDQLYFAALLQVVNQYTVMMQSKINTQQIAAIGMRGFRTSETMEAALSWEGRRVCCLPDSLLTVAVPDTLD